MGSNRNTNGKDTKHADMAQILGRDFTIVNQGLDTKQVSDYIKELKAEQERVLAELNTYKEREEHFNTLTRLAEKTVMEADTLAAEIKAEIQMKAEAEASQIMVGVKELLLKVYDELSAKLADLKEKVAASRKDFEQSLASPSAGTAVQHNTGVAEDVEASKATVEGSEQPDVEDNLVARIHDREIQLDIMPPIDIAQISKIITGLYGLAQVEDAELLTGSDKSSIIVLQSEPVELDEFAKSLAEFPQVEEARVVETETTQSGVSADISIRPKRIEMVLVGAKTEK